MVSWCRFAGGVEPLPRECEEENVRLNSRTLLMSVFLLSACSGGGAGDPGQEGPGGGAESGSDSGSAHEAGSDMGFDARGDVSADDTTADTDQSQSDADTGEDTGADSPADAGTDTGRDGDAGIGEDLGTDRSDSGYQAGDDNEPVVEITHPAPGSLCRPDSIEVRGTARDESSFEVFVRIADGDWMTADGTEDWSAELDLGGLSDGTYTVEARAVDVATNEGTDSIEIVVDGSPPVATINGEPPALSNHTSAALTVGGDGVISYLYSVNGGSETGPNPVGEAIELVLSHSTFTIDVRGIDLAGNEQVDPTTVTFEIDLVAPEATLQDLPPALTSSNSISVGVDGADVVTYRYRLDENDISAPAPVSTRILVVDLDHGAHTLEVWGIDVVGNEQASPTAHGWMVDTEGSVATLSGVPSNPTNSTSASITVGGTDIVSYRYRLNGADSSGGSVGNPIVIAGMTEDLYDLDVWGSDLAGNEQSTPTTASWTVDISPPTAVLADVPSSPTQQTSVSIRVSGAGVVSYRYQLDGGGYSSATNVAERILGADLSAGEHTLNVRGIDAAGNLQINPTALTWNIDIEAPVAMITGAPEGTNNLTAAEVTVSGAQVVSYRWRLDRSAWSGDIPVSTPLSLSTLAGGPHTLEVIGKDAAGNEQAVDDATAASWTTDTQAPTAVLEGVPVSPTKESSARIVVDDTDVVSYQYRLDEGVWSDTIPVDVAMTFTLGHGAHRLDVVASDAVGNWQSKASPTTANWNVDTEAPTALVTNPLDGPTNVASHFFRIAGEQVVAYKHREAGATDWIGELEVSQTLRVSLSTDDTYVYQIIGRDQAGNWQRDDEATILTIVYDTEAPVAVLTGAPEGRSNATSANVTVSGTDVVSYRYRFDRSSWQGPFPIAAPITLEHFSETTHTLEVLGRDSAGNQQPSTEATVATWTTDTWPPTATIEGIPDGPTNQTTIEVTIGGADVVAYRYRFGDYPLGPGEWSEPFSVDTSINLTRSDGVYELQVVGADEAGNWKGDDFATVDVWSVDTEPPVARVTNPPSGPTNEAEHSFRVLGEGVAAYKFRHEDESEWSAERPNTVSMDIVLPSEDSHTYLIVGRDRAGNWQRYDDATELTVVYDISAPEAVINGAPDGVTKDPVAPAITISGTQVSVYRWRLDDGAWSNWTDTSTTLSLGRLSEELHTLRVVGKDEAGNAQAEEDATVATWTVDTTPPTAVLTGVPDDPTNETNADISVGGDQVVSYYWKLNSGNYTGPVSVDETIGLTALDDGRYDISVKGIDAAGNIQIGSTQVSWSVESDPPTAALSNVPPAATQSRSAAITVGGDNVVTYTYRLNGGELSAVRDVSVAIEESDLPDDSYHLEVFGTDGAGNTQEEPTTATWVVDNAPPTASLSNLPDPLDSTLGVGGVQVAGDGVVRYRYQLNSWGYSDPIAVDTQIRDRLSDGDWTLDVLGIDAAGNEQVTPTSHSWTIDATKPVATASPATDTVLHTAMTEITVSFDEPLDELVFVSGEPSSYDLDLTGTEGAVLTLYYPDGLSGGSPTYPRSFMQVRFVATDLAGNTGDINLSWDTMRDDSAIFVDDDAAGDLTGTIDDPMISLETAIEAAAEGDVIFVAEGAYDENIVLASGVEMYGGWHGTFQAHDRDELVSEITDPRSNYDSYGIPRAPVVCASATAGGVFDGFVAFGNGSGNNAGLLVYRGCTAEIRNNEFDGGRTVAASLCYGGYVESSSEGVPAIALHDNTFRCVARYGRGAYGLYVREGINLALRDNRLFVDDKEVGGDANYGLFIERGDGVGDPVFVEHNTMDARYGIYVQGGSFALERNVITGTTAVFVEGATSTGTIDSNLMGTLVTSEDVVRIATTTRIDVRNNTIGMPMSGTGIRFTAAAFGDGDISNNIFYGLRPADTAIAFDFHELPQIYEEPIFLNNNNYFNVATFWVDATPESCDSLSCAGQGCISEDPVFESTSGEHLDFHLTSRSPCNVRYGGRAGSYAASHDLDGVERTATISCDTTNDGAAGISMGAYEY